MGELIAKVTPGAKLGSTAPYDGQVCGVRQTDRQKANHRQGRYADRRTHEFFHARDYPEIAVLEACRELGAAFVAFSPVARGFLAGALRDVAALEPKDLRRNMPRFEPANFAANLKLLDGFIAIADELQCTPAQLALAWVLSRGEHVLAIPGTTKLAHLRKNAAGADIGLSASTLARLDALINPRTVAGPRYDAAAQAGVDTEEF